MRPYEHPARYRGMRVTSSREDLPRGYRYLFRVTHQVPGPDLPQRLEIGRSGRIALTGTLWMPMRHVVFDCPAFPDLDDLAYWVQDSILGREMAYKRAEGESAPEEKEQGE